MISDGYWDLDQLLRQSDRYLELIGPPESEKISVVLRRIVDALRSGENPPEYTFGILEALLKRARPGLPCPNLLPSVFAITYKTRRYVVEAPGGVLRASSFVTQVLSCLGSCVVTPGVDSCVVFIQQFDNHLFTNAGRDLGAALLAGKLGADDDVQPFKRRSLTAVALYDDALGAPAVDSAELHLLGVVVLRDAFDDPHLLPLFLGFVHVLTI
jgi:hypothetical protein